MLYKHWESHTIPREAQTYDIKYGNKFDNPIYSELIPFVNERIRIFERKEADLPKPYSQETILNTYRFCNIYRELDRQTVFFHEYLKPIENDFDLWVLNMLYCRSICNTNTISKIGLLTFSETNNKKVFNNLTSLASPKYGNAYIFPISLIHKSEWNTREKFFSIYYPLVTKKVTKVIKGFSKISVVEAINQILPIFGFNLRFLWTEVLIDIAYQYPQLIDLYQRFPIGPGSKPTMLRINDKVDPEITNLNMVGAFDQKLELLTFNGKKVILSAENWEGIGCEFRKYTNLKLGKGRKRLYK